MSERADITLPHFQLPPDIADYFDKLIITYHKLAKPSTSDDFVSKNKELGPSSIVGRGLSYLTRLGLMKKVGHKYDLEPNAQVLRSALVSDDKNKATQEWQSMLKQHELFAMMEEYLDSVSGMGTAIGFGNYVRTKLGADWGKKFTEDGGRRLCWLFGSKGLVGYDQDTENLSFKKTEPVAEQLGKGEKGLERTLLLVAVDGSGSLNVKVSDEFDVKLSRRIIDMVLGAREPRSIGNEKQKKGRHNP
mgnify:FL=1